MWIHGTESRKSMGTNFTFFPIFALGLQASIPEKRQDPKIKDACESFHILYHPAGRRPRRVCRRTRNLQRDLLCLDPSHPLHRTGDCRPRPQFRSPRPARGQSRNVRTHTQTVRQTPTGPADLQCRAHRFETTLLAKILNPRQNRRPEPRNPTHRRDTAPTGKARADRTKGWIGRSTITVMTTVWTPMYGLPPKALKIMAENAFTAIREQYPDSVRYRGQFRASDTKIDELDARTRQKIELSGVKYFIVYHPRPHLLRPRLRNPAGRHRNRRQGAFRPGNSPESSETPGKTRSARYSSESNSRSPVVEVIAQDMEAEYIEIDPLDEQVLKISTESPT